MINKITKEIYSATVHEKIKWQRKLIIDGFEGKRYYYQSKYKGLKLGISFFIDTGFEHSPTTKKVIKITYYLYINDDLIGEIEGINSLIDSIYERKEKEEQDKKLQKNKNKLNKIYNRLIGDRFLKFLDSFFVSLYIIMLILFLYSFFYIITTLIGV